MSARCVVNHVVRGGVEGGGVKSGPEFVEQITSRLKIRIIKQNCPQCYCALFQKYE